MKKSYRMYIALKTQIFLAPDFLDRISIFHESSSDLSILRLLNDIFVDYFVGSLEENVGRVRHDEDNADW